MSPIEINEGDIFSFSPWGGDCKAHYINGCLRMYRIKRGIRTRAMSWKCQSSADTQKLLKGEAVQVKWEEKCLYNLQAQAGNKLGICKGGKVYNFERKGIRINEGDIFSYEPWRGGCVATFVGGCLRMYRSSRGKNTIVCSWSCRSAEDTQKLLTGAKVQVLWDGRERHTIQVTDNQTLTVWHGRKACHFKRMNAASTVKECDRFSYGSWGGECVATYNHTIMDSPDSTARAAVQILS